MVGLQEVYGRLTGSIHLAYGCVQVGYRSVLVGYCFDTEVYSKVTVMHGKFSGDTPIIFSSSMLKYRTRHT